MTALRRLAASNDGATLVEFAFVAPVFLLLLMGTFDVGHMVYIRATLQGALQDAARDAGLESGAGNIGAIDTYVSDQVKSVVPSGELSFQRRNYKEFGDVGQPEDFTDKNGNDAYDSNECFFDENGNGSWDADKGKDGLGGAKDVALYTVTVSYDRLFPFWRMVGAEQEASITGSTTLRNQPFGSQDDRGIKQICPGA